jgi:glucose-6-phosphate-specific signal transduction histidine kinase
MRRVTEVALGLTIATLVFTIVWLALRPRNALQEIALSNGDGSLAFTVTDDGGGFDTEATSYGTGLQGIADRLAAMGGTVEVRSTVGEGTAIEGRLPAERAG